MNAMQLMVSGGFEGCEGIVTRIHDRNPMGADMQRNFQWDFAKILTKDTHPHIYFSTLRAENSQPDLLGQSYKLHLLRPQADLWFLTGMLAGCQRAGESSL